MKNEEEKQNRNGKFIGNRFHNLQRTQQAQIQRLVFEAGFGNFGGALLQEYGSNDFTRIAS